MLKINFFIHDLEMCCVPISVLVILKKDYFVQDLKLYFVENLIEDF
jgi:hypothetical protein